jgi:hypothetical protein
MHKTAQSLCFRLISSMYCELKSEDEYREGQVTIYSLEMSLSHVTLKHYYRATSDAFVFGMTTVLSSIVMFGSEHHSVRSYACPCPFHLTEHRPSSCP